MEQLPAWETLIASRSRPTKPLSRIEDPVKRNAAEATKRWRAKNKEHYEQKRKEWEKANPDKMKIYAERRKPAIKAWAESHKERVLELNRKSDRKRQQTEHRKQWQKEYDKRPEVIARRKEQNRIRNQTPERKEYERLRSQRRREQARLLKQQKGIENEKQEKITTV